MQVVNSSGNEATVDVCGSWVLPFTRGNVQDELWRFFLEESSEEDGYSWSQDLESRDDTIIGVFQLSCTVDGHHMSFDGKYVAKNVRTAQDNVVFVSHGYSEPRSSSRLLDDVVVEEDSWVRVVDGKPAGARTLDCPLAMVQHVRRFCIRLTPKQAEEPMKNRSINALVDVLMRQVEDEMERGEQYIENKLLRGQATLARVT
jgi:hypothetical protein